MTQNALPWGQTSIFFGNPCRKVVKGCDPEMISRTFCDHNLGGQPWQLATGNLHGGSKIIHVALLIGSDCADGITTKPLNIKTVLICLDRGRFVLVHVCLILSLRHYVVPLRNAKVKNAVKFVEFCTSKVTR